MKVAVWDTYVIKEDGNALNFDIIVPEDQQDPTVIYAYGKNYLDSINESKCELDAAKCQYCHVETPTGEMLEAIERQGYYILEIAKIPARLPDNPSRRDMILHLRAFYPEHRFADFRGHTVEDLYELTGR